MVQKNHKGSFRQQTVTILMVNQSILICLVIRTCKKCLTNSKSKMGSEAFGEKKNLSISWCLAPHTPSTTQHQAESCFRQLYEIKIGLVLMGTGFSEDDLLVSKVTKTSKHFFRFDIHLQMRTLRREMYDDMRVD